MPTYEYQCEKCRKGFEFFQSMKDAALTTCPKEACRQKTWGKGKVKRQLGTGAGLIFKGSGFYITDYRSDKYKQAAKKDSGTAASSPASTSTSTTSSSSSSSSGGDSGSSGKKPAEKNKTPKGSS